MRKEIFTLVRAEIEDIYKDIATDDPHLHPGQTRAKVLARIKSVGVLTTWRKVAGAGFVVDAVLIQDPSIDMQHTMNRRSGESEASLAARAVSMIVDHITIDAYRRDEP